ncbi:MAG TPA: hypothetical protein LFV90_07780 [Rickettsia endosymbiont of Columbicola hoogstraali]|nr:hypothetical protein [Rickettsia endosymbiont of Columbicola hoogstraali]
MYSGYYLYQYLIDKNNHGHGNRNNSNTNENIELQSLVPVEITSTPAEAIRPHIQQQNNQNGFYSNNTDDIHENNIESNNCSTNTEWSHSRIETENNTGNMNINNTYLHDTEVIGDTTL